jgi:serine-type D-Ala-D-Ala carboxypeptidase/endopeptidase
MRADKRRHTGGVLMIVASLTIAGCGSTPKTKPAAPKPGAKEPWKLAIAAQVKPYLASEVVTGVAIGVIDGEREWTYGFGSAGNSGAAPTKTTLFELGAVTQVYTGVLVAEAIERREVELAAELASVLPLGVTAPTRDGAAITIGHLVEHRSGLPDVPAAFGRIPPPRYTVDALFADLARTPLRSPPGQAFAYSAFGYAVLGAAVATKAGAASWSAAVEDRVLAPLGLADTAVAVQAGQSTRHAVGHADDGRTAAYAGFGALDAALGLRSTVADQLKFLRANLDAAAGKPGPLAAALRRTHGILATGKTDAITLGWFVDDRGRLYRGGQTDGFHAFIEIDLDKRKAVIVLASTATSLVDQLGDAVMDVIGGARPVPIKLPTPEQLMPLVGIYKVANNETTITVELDGRKLMARTPDGTRSRLMPAGGVRFYIERDRAFVTFDGAAPAQKFLIETAEGRLLAERVAEPAAKP